MNINLVVVRPFGTYSRGALIVDPATVAAVLAGENALKVVRILPAGQSATQGA